MFFAQFKCRPGIKFFKTRFRPGIKLFKSRCIWIPGLKQTWNWEAEFQVYFNKSFVARYTIKVIRIQLMCESSWCPRPMLSCNLRQTLLFYKAEYQLRLIWKSADYKAYFQSKCKKITMDQFLYFFFFYNFTFLSSYILFSRILK